jgi:branched-chain amino acid transport system substrate-binding protein
MEPVRELLAAKPDTILIISNAIDSALICQQIRKLDTRVGIVMSEWASTERFIELGGKATNGVCVSQFLNRNDTSDRYQKFLATYRKRFRQEPGFAGVAGYDAALVALDALSTRKPGMTLRETILRTGKFQGLQQQINIDRFGDADRKTFVTRISNGKFETME